MYLCCTKSDAGFIVSLILSFHASFLCTDFRNWVWLVCGHIGHQGKLNSTEWKRCPMRTIPLFIQLVLIH
jgi:hypothetical protein